MIGYYTWSLYMLIGLFGLSYARDVFSLGYPRLASDAGADLSGQGAAIFLLDERFPAPGVFFAFESYYRNNNPVRLQIWRPSGGTPGPMVDGAYVLVGEVEQIPVVERGVELTYIVSKFTEKCIKVSPGDRLGVMITNSSSALAYTFTDTKLYSLVGYWDQQALGGLGDGYPSVGDGVSFKKTVFPYLFSLAAFYYTDSNISSITQDEVDCPGDLLISGDPKYTTTLAPLSKGPPGATGPPGPMGDTGAPGSTGLQGPSGSTGYTGAQGTAGSKGQPGASGGMGATGLPGFVGATGSQGSAGSTGATGVEGVMGPVGAMGPPGRVIFVNGSEYTQSVVSLFTESAAPLVAGLVEEPLLGWFSETRMIGAIIWLCILSLIVILLFIALIALTHLHRAHGMAGTLRRSTYSSDAGLHVLYPDSTLSTGRGVTLGSTQSHGPPILSTGRDGWVRWSRRKSRRRDRHGRRRLERIPSRIIVILHQLSTVL